MTYKVSLLPLRELLDDKGVAGLMNRCGLALPHEESPLAINAIDGHSGTFVVTVGESHVYLLEQGSDERSARGLAREAHFLEALSGTTTALKTLLPTVHFYDRRLSILVLQCFHAKPKVHRIVKPSRLSPTQAGRLGEALAALHRAPGGVPPRSSNRLRPPEILTFHRPTPESFFELTAAEVEMLRILQAHEPVASRLDQLRSSWREDCLIHGSVSIDNLLVDRRHGAASSSDLQLVNWADARRGDPCWDVGGAISDLFCVWLDSIASAAVSTSVLQLSPGGLSSMMNAIRSLWNGYDSGIALHSGHTEDWAIRSVLYAGARLIQAARESSKRTSSLGEDAAYRLQFGMNILERPREMARELLGLPLSKSGSQ